VDLKSLPVAGHINILLMWGRRILPGDFSGSTLQVKSFLRFGAEALRQIVP
jgi:hypothetical protein